MAAVTPKGSVSPKRDFAELARNDTSSDRWTGLGPGPTLNAMFEALRDPEVLGGTPVFRGTRVPVRTLIEYLEGGQTVDEFVDDFPSVRRDQVVAILNEFAEQRGPKAG